jgi:hypothetical protein
MFTLDRAALGVTSGAIENFDAEESTDADWLKVSAGAAVISQKKSKLF